MTVIRILIMIVIIASTGVIRCNKINNDVHNKNSMLHNSISHIHNKNDDGNYNTNTNTIKVVVIIIRRRRTATITKPLE